MVTVKADVIFINSSWNCRLVCLTNIWDDEKKRCGMNKTVLGVLGSNKIICFPGRPDPF